MKFTILKIMPFPNGAHANQTFDAPAPVPEGWAYLPPSLGTPETLENFPFGEITVETMDIGIPVGEENGEVIMETLENAPTVTGWTPMPMPEPEPLPEEPPQTDQEARLTALEKETAALTAAIERGLSL